MINFLKCVPCLFLGFFVSCSLFVAGTTEETNALAGQDKDDLLSSSAIETSLSSSGPVQGISSSSAMIETPTSSAGTGVSDSVPYVTDPEPNIMLARYWTPYRRNVSDTNQVKVQVEATDEEELIVSYEVAPSMGGLGGVSQRSAVFGIAIRVAGDGPEDVGLEHVQGHVGQRSRRRGQHRAVQAQFAVEALMHDEPAHPGHGELAHEGDEHVQNVVSRESVKQRGAQPGGHAA